MPFIARQEPFTCEHCGASVSPLEKGSYRNHCPHCLWSKHVDAAGPGDRASVCQGLMEPLSLDHDGKKGWMIVHLCQKCGKQIPNKAAPDDEISTFAPAGT
ncbi:MAG: RNHCP domain-containing protein [Candidatus Peribacteraceae bacterium]